MTTTEPLRIGVLGASRIAPAAVIRPARALGHRLVTVAARDPQRASAYAEEHGFERASGSYEELIADPQIDAIYNGLPNAMHGPWNLAAIAAGKHVLGEKPFTSNADEALEVQAAASESGLVVMEAFHYLYHPLMLRVEELLTSGELGEVRHADIDMIMPPPAPEDPRWSFPLAGGSLMDVGCYAFHLARFLGRWAGGEPAVTSAVAVESSANPGVDADLTAELAYPGGATATVRSGMSAPAVRFGFHLACSQGSIEAPAFVLPMDDDRLIIKVDGASRTEHLGTTATYEYMLAAFAAAVRDGIPLRNDLDDAVAQMRLIDAAYLASGLPVRPILQGISD